MARGFVFTALRRGVEPDAGLGEMVWFELCSLQGRPVETRDEMPRLVGRSDRFVREYHFPGHPRGRLGQARLSGDIRYCCDRMPSGFVPED